MGNVLAEMGMAGQPAENVNRITATGSINVYDQVNIVDTSSGAVAVTLPSVAEAKGRLYSFIKIGGGTNALTLLTLSDDAPTITAVEALSMEDDNDGCVLYSDGISWWIMASQQAD